MSSTVAVRTSGLAGSRADRALYRGAVVAVVLALTVVDAGRTDRAGEPGIFSRDLQPPRSAA